MLPPTPLEQALHIHGLLIEDLQTLKLLEEELKGHPVQDIHKRVRRDRVSLAIGYLQMWVDELGAATT